MSTSVLLYALIKKTSSLLDESDRQLFEQFNLSASRFDILRHAYENPGINPSALSEKLLCHKSNVTHLIRRMEQEGHLSRRRSRADHRIVHVLLTERGKALYLQAQTAYEKHVRNRLRRLDADEQRLLVERLGLLFQTLHEETTVSLKQTN